MNILEQIKDLISIEQKSSNSFRIHLPVLYADGENVCVDIIENKSSYFISDNGFGLENAFAQVDNISTSDIERIGKSVSKTYGLNISKKYTIQELNKLKIKPENNNKDNGIVYLNDVSINELNGAIMMVANASKVFSHKLVEDNIIAEELSLKERLRVYDIDGDPVDIKIAEKRTPEQMKSIMKNLNNIQLACCKTAREIELEKKLDIAVKALEFYEKPFSCFHPEYNIAQHHKKAAEALAKIKEIEG